jgi:hypothetical protein
MWQHQAADIVQIVEGLSRPLFRPYRTAIGAYCLRPQLSRQVLARAEVQHLLCRREHMNAYGLGIAGDLHALDRVD